MSTLPRVSGRAPAEQSNLSNAPLYYTAVPFGQQSEGGPTRVPLSHYLWVLRRHLWKMAAFVAVCVLATFIVTSRETPIYESTATVDVDWEAPSQVVGTDSNQPTYGHNQEEFLATQVKLIQSDSVLRPVAEQFHLVGGDGKSGSMATAKAQLLASAPIGLPGLKVTRPTNTYLLLVSYRSPDPRRAAEIANAVARSYLLQTYDLQIRSSTDLSSFMERQLDELKAKMERSNLALAQFEKDLDVVNPDEKTDILSSRLVQLNNDYTTAQTDRIRAEAVWNAIKSGPLDTAAALSGNQDLAKLNDTLNAARQHFAIVKATYGTTHPEYRKAASDLTEVENEVDQARTQIADQAQEQYKESLSREQLLKAAVGQAKAEWSHVNARSFQYQQVKQEADADKALYNELITKIREANINQGFQNNNIRIADYARPPLHPVYPDKKLNFILALLFSAFIAVGAAIFWDSLDTTLRDPKEASRFLEIDVIGTIPVDQPAAQLPRTEATSALQIRSPNGTKERRNGSYYEGARFDEAIRTLRNTILLSDFEGRLHSIVLTSATPGEGKTTLVAHLAIANADRGKKTLVLDGDLRRPSLHSKFGLNPNRGLANVLTGELPWQEAVIPIEGNSNLALLPAGVGSHRAADLIGPRLSTLLDEFAKQYEMVILDAPPLLGFAECLQMASAADGVLIVSRAGETKRRAVAEVIATLRRVRGNIVGVVLNQLSQKMSPEGYSHYGYYHHEYSRHSGPQEPEAVLHSSSNR